MDKIQQKFTHEFLNRTRVITVQDLTMLSRLDPRISTFHAEIIAEALMQVGQAALHTELTFEEVKSSLPLRLWKWLTGDKDRIRINVKMGDFEVIHFYSKNRLHAEHTLKMAHYLNAIAQANKRTDKASAIKSAQVFIRNSIRHASDRKWLFDLIEKVSKEGKRLEKAPLFTAEVQRLGEILDRMQKGERIFDHEKFTLDDLAKLLELEKAPRDYQPRHLKKVMDALRDLVQKNTPLQSGDIGLTDIDKKNILDSQDLNRLERLFKSVLKSPYLHAQTFIRGKIHHIVQEYRESEANIKLQAQCVFLRIHPEELLEKDPQIEAALRKQYGDNYRSKMDAMYRKIQDSLHDMLSADSPAKKGKYARVKNSFKHMMKTGLAHWFFPLQKRLRKSRTEFEAAHTRVYGEKSIKKAKYHCTEFVAEITIAALSELDRELRNELGEEFANRPIIRLPFSERERVRFLGPARLIEELKKRGAITQVPPNPVLVELLKQNDLDWSDPALFSGLISRPSPVIGQNK